MENLLNLDLNAIVNKEVKETIESLEDDNKNLRELNSEYYSKIKELENRINEVALYENFGISLKENYKKIEASKPDKDGWFESKQKRQFLFIENILLNLFSISKKHSWTSSRDWGALAPHLAVNYYDNKQELINILEILNPSDLRTIEFIKGFKMPYDYEKDKVLNYVKHPKYNTNGCIFGISSYWIEAGAGVSNMPHDLIMKNPLILTDEVFEELIKTIKSKQSNFYYLFALPNYNSNVSDSQIQELGECLLGLHNDTLNYDVVKAFISNNLKKFNDKTLEFLYRAITHHNQFNTLHWEKFPNHYQAKFLKSKTLEEVLKIFTDYSCKWTTEEKERFLKEYLVK